MPVWTWACGEGNNCTTIGSTKALRVYKDNGVEKIAAVPGTRSSIVVVDGLTGNQLQERFYGASSTENRARRYVF